MTGRAESKPAPLNRRVRHPRSRGIPPERGKLAKVDVVGVGLNATDTLIPLPEYPARGSKVAFRDAHILPGGQVATAVAACAHWGLLTRYVGKVGDDHAGRLHRDEFDRLGVEAHLLIAKGCKSQQAFIIVDDTGERTVLWKRDKRLTLRARRVAARMDHRSASTARRWA